MSDVKCTYCGTDNPETVDHVPPICLFPSSRRINLITVPCCLQMQPGASKDDEYFKAMVLLRADVAGKPIVADLVQSVVRGLSKPSKRGMLRSLLRRMQKLPVHTPSGLYLGDAGAYVVDTARLGKVTNRIVEDFSTGRLAIGLPLTYRGSILGRIGSGRCQSRRTQKDT